MARPPLPLGTYGRIKTWQDGKTWLARAQFRGYDGNQRHVKPALGSLRVREVDTPVVDRVPRS